MGKSVEFSYEIQYTKVAEKRVVYAIINGKIVVIHTLLAGSRGDVYKKMSGLK